MWTNIIKPIFLLLIFSFLVVTASAQEAQNNFIIEGIKMYDKKDYEGALEMYKKALTSNPASVQAKYEIASTYLQLKDYNNTIKYSEKVIAANKDYVDQAYILKGSALDYLLKSQDAANTYKQAIKKFPKNQLLYYNLALTSFNLKNYKETDAALQQSLRLNPLHASSHFLLGLSMVTQGKRVQGMLALYNFLLLEPKSKKSAAVLQTLEDEWKKGTVKPASNKTTAKKDSGEFYTIDLMVDVLEAAKNNEVNKNKPAIVLFAENTNSFFTILGESKKDKKGFWWNFYVDYFYKLALNHHTEALCYYITQSKNGTYDEWVKEKNNLKTMESFSEWYTKYLHKF
jgi:tetratricopeptide (TPR) repeat protein